MSTVCLNNGREVVSSTNLKRVSIKVVLLASLVICGCSKSNSPVPEADVSTTGLSAAAGAALGAGMGAIIGSATGDAGAGLAIGTAAGAVAGGTIGYQLEQQENAIADQDERLARQSEQISEQAREIQELKQEGGDRIQSYDAPPKSQRDSFAVPEPAFVPPIQEEPLLPPPPPVTQQEPNTFSQNDRFEIPSQNASSRASSASVQRYEGSPQAQSWSDKHANSRAEERDAARREVRARMGAVEVQPSSAPVAQEPVFEQNLDLPPAQSSPPAVAAPAPKLPPAQEPEAIAETDSFESVSEVSEPEIVEPKVSKPVPEKKAASSQVAKKAPKSPLPEDANCEEADTEATRARAATSDADKLFYFRRALRLCPKEPSYHIEIGKVYGTIGRTEDARFEFNKALELDPENSEAQDELSMLMLDNSY